MFILCYKFKESPFLLSCNRFSCHTVIHDNRGKLKFKRILAYQVIIDSTDKDFLTGCPPIPDMIYVNENCYLQAIKIPPNLKQVWRVLVKSFGHSNTAHQIAVFLIW